jgi:alpha-mannosidase
MNRLHLICNAHLDPVWLWEWEEGAAEANSTFRVAADLCEEFSGFVFNHNEVTLYRWVEEYEPALFARIQRLVAEGKWHIMGGWYLQPDCNMPSGESFVRQILVGKGYFKDKFGVEPTTAINFDPFGHNRGLVQILRKAGYDSYLFCRPGQDDCALPSDDFTWVGFDGSEIMGHRSSSFYNQPLGKAHEKVENWIQANPDKPVGLVYIGVSHQPGAVVQRFSWPGTREQFKRRTSQMALDLLRRFIIEA